jgi:hypothetical protein
MKRIQFLLCFFLLASIPVVAQSASEKKEVLQVVQQFFDVLEKQDTVAFVKIFLPDAQNYYVSQERDSLTVRTQPSRGFKFRPDRIIKERMRKEEVSVQVHRNIAMVWAPYDLWINNQFSHCGVDVFTLISDKVGWKVASLSYTIERQGCEHNRKVGK